MEGGDWNIRPPILIHGRRIFRFGQDIIYLHILYCKIFQGSLYYIVCNMYVCEMLYGYDLDVKGSEKVVYLLFECVWKNRCRRPSLLHEPEVVKITASSLKGTLQQFCSWRSEEVCFSKFIVVWIWYIVSCKIYFV